MTKLPKIHDQNKEIFIKELFEEIEGRTNACKIWDHLTDEDTDNNCLGENLNQIIHIIRIEFFENYSPTESTDLSYYFTTYILWLYLIVERVDFVFDVITSGKEVQLFISYKQRYYKTSQTIRKWANFIKHPREFLFSHWPEYQFELPDDEALLEDTVIINLEYVKKHYSKPKAKIKELENQPNVIVHMPDLIELTKSFCEELNRFFDFVCDNEFIADYLKSKTTLEDYYEYLEEEAD